MLKTLLLLIDGEIVKPAVQDADYFQEYEHIIYECSAYYVRSKYKRVISSYQILQCNQLSDG